MNGYYAITVITVITLIIGFIFLRKNKIEGYYDITPYDYHWDIFKCYTIDCIKDKAKK